MTFRFHKRLITHTIFAIFGLCGLSAPVTAEITLQGSGTLGMTPSDDLTSLPALNCSAMSISTEQDRSVKLLDAVLREDIGKKLSAFTPVSDKVGIQDCGAFFVLSILSKPSTIVRHVRLVVEREAYLDYIAGQPMVRLRFRPESLRERYRFLLIGF